MSDPLKWGVPVPSWEDLPETGRDDHDAREVLNEEFNAIWDTDMEAWSAIYEEPEDR